MRNLNECRIQDLDDIFYATRDSQGLNNAIMAIKYVLFDDKSVFKDETPVENKYLYISSDNNARKKAMILQTDDLAHILIKYCMQSFGLRGKPFNITDDEFIINKKRIDRLEISPYEMIEQVSYAAMGDIYVAYEFLFANHQILVDVVDYMLNERYVMELKEALDKFNGIIDNKHIKESQKFDFFNAYSNIDSAFGELKRNDKEYIK